MSSTPATLSDGRSGDRHNRFLLLLAVLGTGLTFLAGLPLPAGAAVVVRTPTEVLDTWTVASAGRLFFPDPDGGLYEFVTDVSDPVITNKGDGDFYPLDPEIVRKAVESVRYPIDDLDVTIFILPYPRRGLLDSSAGHATIYLSPGVTPYQEVQIHAVVAHEMGHLVHNQLMPDTDAASWDRYRSLRGIGDDAVYNDRALHRNRPHEIFAEDFRFLFGGDLANYSGSIENSDLPLPSGVPGLNSFFQSLAWGSSAVADLPVTGRLNISPNPARSGVSITFNREVGDASGGLALSIFDAQGRLVDQRDGVDPSGLRWEGRLADGRPAPPGLYFVRLSRGDQRWTGKVLISR